MPLIVAESSSDRPRRSARVRPGLAVALLDFRLGRPRLDDLGVVQLVLADLVALDVGRLAFEGIDVGRRIGRRGALLGRVRRRLPAGGQGEQEAGEQGE